MPQSVIVRYERSAALKSRRLKYGISIIFFVSSPRNFSMMFLPIWALSRRESTDSTNRTVIRPNMPNTIQISSSPLCSRSTLSISVLVNRGETSTAAIDMQLRIKAKSWSRHSQPMYLTYGASTLSKFAFFLNFMV